MPAPCHFSTMTCASASVLSSNLASSAASYPPILAALAQSRNVDLVVWERLSPKPLSQA